MPKRIYQVGELCDICGTPTIPGKDGNGYCKPCYIAWKNKQGELPPSNHGNAPQVNSKPYRATPQAMETRKEFQNTMDYKSNQIAKAQTNKEDSMRLFSSSRDATLIVVAFMAQGSAWDDDEAKMKIKEWQKFFYNEIYNEKPFI